jgi:hypothetical protein
MLASTYLRLHEWMSAEEIMQWDFDGKEQSVERLVWCYCEHGKWDDAEKLLCPVIGSHNEEADVTESGTPQFSERKLWQLQALAEVYLAKGDYEWAIEACETLIDKTVSTLGEEHVICSMHISLLAKIYESKGDKVNAQVYTSLSQSGIEGTIS